MFICLPTQIDHPSEKKVLPAANLIFISINLLIYFFPRTAYNFNYFIYNIITYSFVHVSFWHLFGNMWVLWVFGNKVNRRLGNFWYSVVYLGTSIACGILLRSILKVNVVGASGVTFSIIAICIMLMPASRINFLFIVLLPMSLIIGLFNRPKHWVLWLVRWGEIKIKALWCLFLIPGSILFILLWGWNWTNLGHLLGLICGMAAVLILPKRVTMTGRSVYPIGQFQFGLQG